MKKNNSYGRRIRPTCYFTKILQSNICHTYFINMLILYSESGNIVLYRRKSIIIRAPYLAVHLNNSQMACTTHNANLYVLSWSHTSLYHTFASSFRFSFLDWLYRLSYLLRRYLNYESNVHSTVRLSFRFSEHWIDMEYQLFQSISTVKP